MEYTIRPMTKQDWGAVIEIFYQGIQTNMATFETECSFYEDWDAKHLQDCRLVIENDGDVVGWAALSPFESSPVFKGVAELSIYINVDNRGKGLGKLLLSALVEESIKAGYWALESYIFKENTASLKLHTACGFRKVGYYERLAKDRFGVWRSLVIMEHRITSDIKGGCDCDMCK